VPIQQHPDDTALSWAEVVDAMAALEGSHVAVRVVERNEPEMLVTVFRGHLGERTRSRTPTVFWPIIAASEHEPGDAEQSGIYLHEDRFEEGVRRAGNTILVVAQGAVLVNVRRI